MGGLVAPEKPAFETQTTLCCTPLESNREASLLHVLWPCLLVWVGWWALKTSLQPRLTIFAIAQTYSKYNRLLKAGKLGEKVILLVIGRSD